MPSEKFKTYKDKVVYILECINDSMDMPSSDLNWCLFVIRNDFL